MIRFIRVAAIAALTVLVVGVGGLLGGGSAHAAEVHKATAMVAGSSVTIALTGGVANANCAASLHATTGGGTTTRTQALNLNASGVGTTTFTKVANGSYTGSVQCPNVTGTIAVTPSPIKVDNKVPPNQCVQLVHDIAWGLGLRGNELAVVMSIARQYCPR